MNAMRGGQHYYPRYAPAKEVLDWQDQQSTDREKRRLKHVTSIILAIAPSFSSEKNIASAP